MEILSRNYGVAENHVRYLTLKCKIQKREYPLNGSIFWKAKKDWEFELIKYEKQDHCLIRFEEMDDSMFIVKSLDYSDHTICDHLYKEDSDEYLKWVVLLHLTELFANSSALPEFVKYSNVFYQHIEM